jgi:hypothetical protein
MESAGSRLQELMQEVAVARALGVRVCVGKITCDVREFVFFFLDREFA